MFSIPCAFKLMLMLGGATGGSLGGGIEDPQPISSVICSTVDAGLSNCCILANNS
jgi:hypothetical protein